MATRVEGLRFELGTYYALNPDITGYCRTWREGILLSKMSKLLATMSRKTGIKKKFDE